MMRGILAATCLAPNSPDLGKSSKALASRYQIGLESPVIQGKNPVRIQIFGKHDEGRVGIVHRNIRVFVDKAETAL